MLRERRPWDFALESMWDWVNDLGAMLRGYTAPEQAYCPPNWSRVATASIALEVARDAIEQDPDVDRNALFDDFVDLRKTRHTFSRKAHKRIDARDARYYRSVGVGYPFGGLHRSPWWHSNAWGGDGSHGTGGVGRAIRAAQAGERVQIAVDAYFSSDEVLKAMTSGHGRDVVDAVLYAYGALQLQPRQTRRERRGTAEIVRSERKRRRALKKRRGW